MNENGSPDNLEYQSYINIMMLAFRQGKVPYQWKFMDIEKVLFSQNCLDKTLPYLSMFDNSPT